MTCNLAVYRKSREYYARCAAMITEQIA